MVQKIWKKQDEIIDLFCKTFFVSQEPHSLEELRALFEMCELEEIKNSDLTTTFRIKIKDVENIRPC